MIDFTEKRQSAIQSFEHGEPDRLLNLLATNSLNAREREFIAELVRASVPKGATGPNRRYAKPIKAALVWFWGHEMDKHPRDAVYKEIEILLGVKQSMVRKYLDQMKTPVTQGAQWAKVLAQHEICKRKQAVEWGDEELIRLYRSRDFAPIAPE